VINEVPSGAAARRRGAATSTSQSFGRPHRWPNLCRDASGSAKSTSHADPAGLGASSQMAQPVRGRLRVCEVAPGCPGAVVITGCRRRWPRLGAGGPRRRPHRASGVLTDSRTSAETHHGLRSPPPTATSQGVRRPRRWPNLCEVASGSAKSAPGSRAGGDQRGAALGSRGPPTGHGPAPSRPAGAERAAQDHRIEGHWEPARET
jgi:hypothetical protein